MLGSLIGPLITRRPSFIGTAVSALFLTWLLESLRFMREYRMAFYGLIMILLVVMQPQLQAGIRKLVSSLVRRERSTYAS